MKWKYIAYNSLNVDFSLGLLELSLAYVSLGLYLLVLVLLI